MTKTKLELTWPNKDQFLLVPKDEDGKPVWVSRDHPAAHEVRLTRELASVGEIGSDPVAGNTVFVGDSLDAMRVLLDVPEFAERYAGQVKLIYADPPFNTGQAFEHYDDWMEHATWLSFMRDRLMLMRELLAPDGSVWIHLDDTEQHRMRLLMDEVFGAENFVATIAWQKADSPRMDAKQFSSSHDYIHVYTRSTGWRPNRYAQDGGAADDYPYVDEDGRRFRSSPLRKWGKNSARSDRPNLWYPIEGPDGTSHWPIKPDGTEGNWRWQASKVKAEADRLQWIDKGSGFQPYVKEYEDADKSPVPPQTWWSHDLAGHNRSAKAHGKQLFGRQDAFATPKPEQLLQHIIYIGTNPGDLVFDPFAGSGTTAAVAHKMGRRYATVELSPENTDTYVVPRLAKVVAGADPGGITDDVGWQGGGGFRVVAIEPSIYEVGDDNVVFLREDVSVADLGRAVAGQLRFTYAPDAAPFCGQRGRMLLAVAPGIVGAEEIDDLVARLPEGCRLTIAAGALIPGAADHLAQTSRGSRAMKIPRDILMRTRRSVAREEEPRA
ncbi:MAG: site-specific DNA-methyltransferase [Actinomycetales bacterium]|nr:site-specific DNA-methyltransferase [Actinomycetales bacterium]